MEGSDWVALASVVSSLAVAVFTQIYQRRGERERRDGEEATRSAQHARELDDRRRERWLDLRRDLYARFLRGADALEERAEERTRWILFGGPPDPNPEVGNVVETEATDLIVRCTEALEEMRLFASGEVVSAASEYIVLAIEVENMGVQGTWQAGDLHASGSADIADFVEVVKSLIPKMGERAKVARKVLAAMRDDLGADPASDMPGLGGVVQFSGRN
ncbi:hypothetical protein [Promicromonospora sukumoe]|uniref:hypothetical protein n=1 Tax=Promicromonospora sukumoe TaxID=88382 RepID=UPI00364EB195